MLDTIIADDEFHAVERLKELVVRVDELNLIGSFTQASKCLAKIEEGKLSPELLFLDIEMPGYNGLQLAQRVLEMDEGVEIVFVTAYDNYAVKAFELNALDYLLKPIKEERFQKAIERLTDKKEIVSSKESTLKVVSLGKAKLFYQGERIDVEWPTLKAKELFYYLLYYRGEFVARDKILVDLWSDKEPEKAVDILYTTVYSLRKMFKDIGFDEIIKSKRGFYGVDLAKIEWDVIEFEKITAELKENITDAIHKVAKLLSLYQSEYLINESYKWSYGLQAELKEKFKEALFKAADYYSKHNQYEQAIDILQQIIEEVFLAEKAYQRLINIYKKLGNEAAARREYEELRNKFKSEFGIEPELEFE